MPCMDTWIVIKHTAFYDDAIPKIYKVWFDEDRAKDCAREYEDRMMELKGKQLPILDGSDEVADLYNEINEANSFICCTVEYHIGSL